MQSTMRPAVHFAHPVLLPSDPLSVQAEREAQKDPELLNTLLEVRRYPLLPDTLHHGIDDDDLGPNEGVRKP